MRYIAAYLLLQTGGNASPSAADIKKLLSVAGIESDDERLDKLISELKGKVIVLKYHWIAGLKSEPAATIEPVKLADDPIPFIKIIDPPASLILRAEL